MVPVYSDESMGLCILLLSSYRLRCFARRLDVARGQQASTAQVGGVRDPGAHLG